MDDPTEELGFLFKVVAVIVFVLFVGATAVGNSIKEGDNTPSVQMKKGETEKKTLEEIATEAGRT